MQRKMKLLLRDHDWLITSLFVVGFIRYIYLFIPQEKMEMPRVKSIKQLVQVALFIFILTLFLTVAEAAKSPDTGTSQEWASLEGFRSAKFGFNESAVLNAINKDFRVKKKSVSRVVNTNEKTVTLSIDVKDLLDGSGLSKIFYIFGYKSKKLIHVNVVWGRSVQQKPNAEEVVSTANQLRNYFAQKRYQKNGFALNAQLGEGTILVFQGIDQKGRAAVLLLNNPKNKDGKVGDSISLTLSYVEKPKSPDVFKIKDGDF